MRRSALRVSSALAVLACSCASLAQGSETAALRAQLAVEERLLTAEILAHQGARVQQEEAIAAVRDVAGRLDEAMARRPLVLDELEGLAMERSVAAAAAQILGQRVEEIEARVLERIRRSTVLRRELARIAAPAALTDPITGRWQLELASPPTTGSFELSLSGTLVEGTYRFEDGRAGSVRGTFVADRLRLERIDAQRGLDGIYDGTVDPLSGVARGFWSPLLLGDGLPGGSSWSAVRLPSVVGVDEAGEREAAAAAEEEG